MIKIKQINKKSWCYKNTSIEKGPFSENEMINFIKKEIIHQNTLILKSGTSKWVMAADSELGAYIKFNKMQIMKGSTEKEVIGLGLAIAPLFGTLSQYFIGNKFFFQYQWIIPLAISIFLCFVDLEVLKKKGYNTNKLKGYAWLAPLYLFHRAKLLNLNIYSFLLWLVSFSISIFI